MGIEFIAGNELKRLLEIWGGHYYSIKSQQDLFL